MICKKIDRIPVYLPYILNEQAVSTLDSKKFYALTKTGGVSNCIPFNLKKTCAKA